MRQKKHAANFSSWRVPRRKKRPPECQRFSANLDLSSRTFRVEILQHVAENKIQGHTCGQEANMLKQNVPDFSDTL